MKTIYKISAKLKKEAEGKYVGLDRTKKCFLKELSKTEAKIAYRSVMGIEIWTVDPKDLELKQELIEVKYKVGDTIVRKDSLALNTGRNPIPYVIEQVKWNLVDINYGFYDGDCWSVIAQNEAVPAFLKNYIKSIPALGYE